jgi:formate-dependent nitrite reductase membrane component NrfD
MTAPVGPHPAVRGSGAHRVPEGMNAARGIVRSAPPIKPPTWKWYIPLYFWTGGIAAGTWTVVTLEDVVGERDAKVVRAGRYLAFGGVLVGTTLLIIDLGRPERFLNMLRIVRGRSTMSLGSWGLAAFGFCTGVAALVQALHDGLLERRSAAVAGSMRELGRAVHVVGLPLALFVGSYTGTLLATTSVPSWASRVRVLGPLFAASSIASGAAALAQLVDHDGPGGDRVHRRLSRVESVGLMAELGLALTSRRVATRLPSARAGAVGRAGEPRAPRAGNAARWLSIAHMITVGAGMVLPLLLAVAGTGARTRGRGWGRARARRGALRRLGVGKEMAGLGRRAGPGLALAGSLALRYLITWEGVRSAVVSEDTWAVTRGRVARGGARGAGEWAGSGAGGEAAADEGSAVPDERGEEPAVQHAGRRTPRVPTRSPGARGPRRVERAEVVGRITVVQEDRVRVVDDEGRGYLFTVATRRPSLADLERWRDGALRVRVRYSGTPDLGARVERIRPLDHPEADRVG